MNGSGWCRVVAGTVFFCLLVGMGAHAGPGTEAVESPVETTLPFEGEVEEIAAEPDERRIAFSAALEVSSWYASGEAGFQFASWPFRSELVYPIEGFVWEVKGEAAAGFGIGPFPARAGVRGRLAGDIRVEGTAKDYDWTFGWFWGYSEHDSRADLFIRDADAFFSVFPLHLLDSRLLKSVELGLILGYGKQSLDYVCRDGWGTYYGEIYIFDGEVATYEMELDGFRAGSYLQLSPLPRFSVRLEALAIPTLHARGEGFWILRDYRFRHKAEGSGSELGLRIAWEPVDHFRVFGAVRRVSLVADRKGRESGVQPGYSYEDLPIVPRVSAEYHGFELGLALAF